MTDAPTETAAETSSEIALPHGEGRFASLAEFWHYFSQSKGAVVGLAAFLLLVLMAILAPWLAPYDPSAQFQDSILLPPVWQHGGNPAFLLGTDAVGRDMLSRIMHGARYSLMIGLLVVTLSLLISWVAAVVFVPYLGYKILPDYARDHEAHDPTRAISTGASVRWWPGAYCTASRSSSSPQRRLSARWCCSARCRSSSSRHPAVWNCWSISSCRKVPRCRRRTKPRIVSKRC